MKLIPYKKLELCHFCGGDAQLDESEPSTARFNEGCVNFLVTCSVFGCTANTFNQWHISPTDAINAWNKRPENKISKNIKLVYDNKKSFIDKFFNCGSAQDISIIYFYIGSKNHIAKFSFFYHETAGEKEVIILHNKFEQWKLTINDK